MLANHLLLVSISQRAKIKTKHTTLVSKMFNEPAWRWSWFQQLHSACDLSGSSKDEQFQSLHGFGQKNNGPPGLWNVESWAHMKRRKFSPKLFLVTGFDRSTVGKERISHGFKEVWNSTLHCPRWWFLKYFFHFQYGKIDSHFDSYFCGYSSFMKTLRMTLVLAKA